jgi:hypothetical protein
LSPFRIGAFLSSGIAALVLALAAARPATGQTAAKRPGAAPPSEVAVARLLATRCLECHSASMRKAGLDLTQPVAAALTGKRGTAVVAGKPEASLLWKRVAADQMPPTHPLSRPEKALLTAWIAAGAPWTSGPIDPLRYSSERRAGYDWWSLQPVRQPALPRVKRKEWIRNPIDAFVLAKLEAVGLAPSPPASATELIRRVTYDLTGLPPTPEEVGAFLRDCREEALGVGPWALGSDPRSVTPTSGTEGLVPTPNAQRLAPKPSHTPTLPHSHTASQQTDPPVSGEAYERLVDRLLASPRYGERWARHWLDVVRFGESQGFERNRFRPNAWRYRDWVVEALNSDLPYDEFVRLQIAGDVLRPDDPLSVIASGFLVVGPYDLTAYTATSPMMMAAAREEEIEGLVGTVAQTFLGLTANCGRCHDHKFDPISQREYYRLAAALGGTYHGAERECLSPAGKAAAERERELLGKQIAALQERLAALPGDAAIERTRLRDELERLESRARLLAGGPAHVIVPKQPGPFHILARGDFRKKGELVAPGGIASLSGVSAEWGLAPDAPEAERRKALAAWITNAQNPLTARVIVNRLWTGHFGAGLVRTPNDFGFNGGLPSHPELLDFLASAFVRKGPSPGGDGETERQRDGETRAARAALTSREGADRKLSPSHRLSLSPSTPGEGPGSGSADATVYAMGWSLKKLHRLILLSSAYRQASGRNPAGESKDAENRLLWRQNPRRLEAEAFRDAALFVAGDLDPRIGGPGFKDWTSKVAGENESYTLVEIEGPEFNRRTLYRTSVRAGTSPFLDVLDCPDPSVSTPRRSETTTPQQALSLLNNRFVERAAARWSERLEREAPGYRRAQVARAYRLAFGRAADAAELRFGESFAAQHGLAQLCLVLLNTNEFLYVD